LPENRHNKSWVVWDLQSSQDLFIGSKNQTDFTIMKRTTDKLLGEEWSWFPHIIDKKILKVVEPMGFKNVENLPDEVTTWLLKKKHLCRVYDLPDNFGYIIWENGEYRLKKFNMDFPWHHKSDQDNFFDDTGIEWKIDWNKFHDRSSIIGQTTGTTKKSVRKNKNEFYLDIQLRLERGDKYDKIIADLKDNKNYQWIKWDAMDAHKLSNNYKYWESSQDNPK